MISKKAKTRYRHNDAVHNLKSSQDFVAYLNSIFKPKSVIDIGCGLGNFLYNFKELNVETVLGVDGSWVDRKKVAHYLNEVEFLEHNLEKPLKLNKRFDLVLSLEVAEHLSESSAKTHVKNLVSMGDVIIFSAAIPFQGGQNHINEQWQSYWTTRFNDEGYEIIDVIRPNLWNNDNIPFWYRQYTLVYINKNAKIELPNSVPILDIVHPELYQAKVLNIETLEVRLKEVLEGKMKVYFYFKLLLKSIINGSKK